MVTPTMLGEAQCARSQVFKQVELPPQVVWQVAPAEQVDHPGQVSDMQVGAVQVAPQVASQVGEPDQQVGWPDPAQVG